jgi:hypothetical protein
MKPQNKAAESLTIAINQMRAEGDNPQVVATNLMGGAVAVLVESIGPKETANFLHHFADAVAATSELDNVVN